MQCPLLLRNKKHLWSLKLFKQLQFNLSEDQQLRSIGNRNIQYLTLNTLHRYATKEDIWQEIK